MKPMNPETAKAFAGLIASIMSFLGWTPQEYSEIFSLPQTPVVTTATTTQPSQTQNKTPKKPKNSDQAKIPTKKTPDTSQAKTPSTPQKTKETPTTNIQQSPRDNLTLEEKISTSIVNIYCTRILGNTIQKTTGSGVVVDPNGVILTNAHVAEYFLLAQNGNNTSCSIRTESPAATSYKAKLIFISPQWIKNNKNNLSLQTLTGTGEYDYALLQITERVRLAASDVPLPFLPVSDESIAKDTTVFVAGYPAGFSSVTLLDSALYELTKKTTITNVASFDGKDVDVVNTGPTAVAEHGSSGGGVIDADGNLRALIVATTIDPYTNQKNIQAITLPYIKKSIKKESGKSFSSLLENGHEEASTFEKEQISSLLNTLLGK